MAAAQKVEKNEEIRDKVRARATVATNSGEGATELGHQIAKLMATLTKTGQGSNQLVHQADLRREAMEEEGRQGYSWLPQLPQWPDQSGTDCLRPNTPTGHRTGATISRNQGQNSQGLMPGVKIKPTGGTPTPSSVLDAMAGANSMGMPHSNHSFKPVQGN